MPYNRHQRASRIRRRTDELVSNHSHRLFCLHLDKPAKYKNDIATNDNTVICNRRPVPSRPYVKRTKNAVFVFMSTNVGARRAGAARNMQSFLLYAVQRTSARRCALRFVMAFDGHYARRAPCITTNT